jgi:hypothetical protein
LFLYEPPFTTLHSDSLDGLFDESLADEIFEIIKTFQKGSEAQSQKRLLMGDDGQATTRSRTPPTRSGTGKRMNRRERGETQSIDCNQILSGPRRPLLLIDPNNA